MCMYENVRITDCHSDGCDVVLRNKIFGVPGPPYHRTLHRDTSFCGALWRMLCLYHNCQQTFWTEKLKLRSGMSCLARPCKGVGWKNWTSNWFVQCDSWISQSACRINSKLSQILSRTVYGLFPIESNQNLKRGKISIFLKFCARFGHLDRQIFLKIQPYRSISFRHVFSKFFK
jgi:hypothetical protein